MVPIIWTCGDCGKRTMIENVDELVGAMAYHKCNIAGTFQIQE
jgi:hypothetical protein